jgi:hypothetical protein
MLESCSSMWWTFPETHSFSCFYIRNFVTPIIESRCAHLQESDRTWVGNVPVTSCQATIGPSLRDKVIRPSGPRNKLARMGLKPQARPEQASARRTG